MGCAKFFDTAHRNRKLNQLSHEAYRVFMKGLSLCGANRSHGRLSREEGCCLCFEVAILHGGDPHRWEAILEELTTPPEGFENPFWYRQADGSFQVHDAGEYSPPATGAGKSKSHRRKLVMRLSRMGIKASTILDQERLDGLPPELQALFRPKAGGFCFGKSAGRPKKEAGRPENRHGNHHAALGNRHGNRHEALENRHENHHAAPSPSPSPSPSLPFFPLPSPKGGLPKASPNRHGNHHGNRHGNRHAPPSPQGGLSGAALGEARESLAVLFPQARAPDLALAERWSADGLNVQDCLAVVAHLVARQLARGDPMESLAYADRRIRGEGLPSDPEEHVLGFGAMRYQVGFPIPVDQEAERYARRVYDFDPRLGSWAFYGLTQGQNQALSRKERESRRRPARSRKPPIPLVQQEEAGS